MVRTTRRRSAGGRFVASGTSPRTTSLRAPIVTPPFHERSRSEELQPTDVEDRPVRATSYREEKKEAKMEIKNTGLKANPWKVTKDGPTISGHLARIERMLRHTAIDPKTATAYFVLYYSVSDNVKDVLQDRDLTLLPEASLYEQLRKELLTLYYDAGDNSRLRKSLNTIVHRSDMSLAAFFEEVESIVARLRLQGSVVTEDELYDLYCATLRPPYSDWILTYRLDSVPYERARLLMLSRSRSHESHMLAPTPSTFTQLQQVSVSPNSQDQRLFIDFDKLRRENKCMRCFSVGHTAEHCPSPAPAEYDKRCLCCGRGGHRREACRLLTSQKRLICRRCGMRNHLSSACRNALAKTTTPTTSTPAPSTSTPAASSVQESTNEPQQPQTGITNNNVNSAEATWFGMALSSDGDGICLPTCTTTCSEHSPTLPGDFLPLMSEVSLCSGKDDSKYSCKALLDTGAVKCFIKKDFLDSLPRYYVQDRRSVNYSVTVADGRKFSSKESVLLSIATPQKTVSAWCIVYPSLAFPLILGLSCMRSLNLMLFLSSDSILLRADTTESEVRLLASEEKSAAKSSSQQHDNVKPVTNDSSAPNSHGSVLTIDGVAKEKVGVEEDSHLSFLMLDDYSESWEFDVSDPWSISTPVDKLFKMPYEPFSLCIPCEDKFSNYNCTDYRGLTLDSHVDEKGSTIDVQRFVYGIPWVSEKRPPKPSVNVILKFIDSDNRLAKRLKDSGLFEEYSKVFEEYIRRDILVKVAPDDYGKVNGIISHYPVISMTSKSTPVRPVLRGSQYRDIIGSGLGPTKSPSDAVLRSTMPSILCFRLFPYVAVLDLEKAFYMLRNSDDAAFLFCLPWKGALYRMTAPPMGAPHSAAALLHATQLMCTEAYELFMSRHPEIPDGEIVVSFSPYMDDIIVGAASEALLYDAIDSLLSVCRSHGFNCQEHKRRVGTPPKGSSAFKVLGLLWHCDDKIGNQDGPVLPPVFTKNVNHKKTVSLTQRDVMSLIAKFYDPCGICNHILLAMRLILRSEANEQPDIDAFISSETFLSLRKLMSAFKSSQSIPRLLNLLSTRVVYCFADASGFATGNVLTDTALNPIICHSRLVTRNRMGWSIVRKELLSCSEVMYTFTNFMKTLNHLFPGIKVVPILLTDNEANYYRLRKAVSLYPDVEALYKDMPKWEVNTLLSISDIIKRYGGFVYHISGKFNISDSFSRGTALPIPFLDVDVLQAVHDACRRKDREIDKTIADADIVKNCTRNALFLLLDDAISDDLKKRILNEQRNDPKLKPFFDHSQAIPPRLLRKYELIGSTDEESSFISNRITGALVVPASLCAEVALVLHDYFGHINHYNLYRSTIDKYDCGKLRLFRTIEHKCPICIGQRGNRTRRHQLGRKLLRSTKIWELLGVDLIGPFHQAGVRAIDHASMMALICVDAFTGFMVHRVLSDHGKAPVLVEALNSVMLEHGFVMGILSDSDPRYSSAEILAWTKATGIRWSRCPGYTSYLSGFHEAKHKSINRILRGLLQKSRSNGYETDWYKLLPRAVYLCNNVCRPSLGCPIFPADGHYVYGRSLPPSICPLRTLSADAKQSLDDLLPLPIPTTREITRLLWEYSQVISDDHQWVAENIEIGLRNRDVYGGVSIARSDFAKLKIGDKVVRYNFDCLTHKLSQRWLSDIYVVLDTRGVIAAIAKSATDTNIKYEYIGNLKKIIDDDE